MFGNEFHLTIKKVNIEQKGDRGTGVKKEGKRAWTEVVRNQNK